MHDIRSDSGGLDNPLLLRRVPADRQHLAEAVADPAARRTWWELTEAVAEPAQRPAAVAVTRAGKDHVVRIELLAIDGSRDETVLVHLLSELLAAVRRTDAVAVTVSADDPLTRRAVQNVGFILDHHGDAGSYTVSL